MKAKSGFEIVNIDDDYMAIPVGQHTSDFNGTVVLNDVSAFLLDVMKQSCTEDDLLKAVLANYDIDEATARFDIKTMLKKMLEIGLIEE